MDRMDREATAQPLSTRVIGPPAALLVVIAVCVLAGCGSADAERPLGRLEISFALTGTNDLDLQFEPSYQTVIWLEDEAGLHARTRSLSTAPAKSSPQASTITAFKPISWKRTIILFRGRIEIGSAAAESRAEASRSPGQYPAARNLLRDVRATYAPHTK